MSCRPLRILHLLLVRMICAGRVAAPVSRALAGPILRSDPTTLRQLHAAPQGQNETSQSRLIGAFAAAQIALLPLSGGTIVDAC